ncbi:hypothetical protein CNMCM6106_003668 [Aspergillus hiratsukae]|uniref:Zn(2)-C6 fungal-type domain-containing protein n=1 Tax=Aspergillus hiratsukae TaxID=1194566 RepID=A0A8H6QAI3_9EURO|nr:hypothetical protein CNMCM6106_003668 [Aspergillus hiratsukae]
MNPLMDSLQKGTLKRIRQACANCRRRKTKCSGERPICFHCRRNKHTCVYEPYSVTVGDNPPSAPVTSNAENTQLLQRISFIESRLAELSGQTAQQPSNFQESTFRQGLQNDTLPRCLLLAVLASAVRFSTHEFYAGRCLEASEVYAREAWLSVLTDHLTVEDNMGVHVVQTVNMLAVIDYTAGRVNSGWLKIGLAARISQGLGLMGEPDGWLPVAEQEERRRAFWSVYLIDKLISCGRSRPLVILDQDCHIQLPCDESAVRQGEAKKTYTLLQLLNWNTEISDTPSPFALVILLASIFGRCTRYVYANRHTDEIPPWGTKSEYSAINSSLLLFESYAKMGNTSVVDMLTGSVGTVGTIDHQEVGHRVFAHTLFHLCHCLLNHPFVLSLSLKPFGSKVPHSFVTRALQNGFDHATQLVNLLRDVSDAGGHVQSSFYAYCVAIAGGILSIASHEESQLVLCRPSDMLECFQHGIDILDRLANFWIHAANMSVRLRDFHAQRHSLGSVLDATGVTRDLDPMSEETFWSMLDYSIMGSNPRKTSSASGSDGPTMPSPTSWALGTDFLAAASPGVHTSHENMFQGLSPALHDLSHGPRQRGLPPSERPSAGPLLLPEPLHEPTLSADKDVNTPIANNQYSPWEAVASGTTAAILANIIVYPLDTIKTKLQVQVHSRPKCTETKEHESHSPSHVFASYDNVVDAVSHVVREEGISGLYRGLSSSILSTASMNFAYFYWSTKARTVHQRILESYNIPDSNGIVKELLLGAVGGAMAQICTNPIAVIVTRQQTCRGVDEAQSIFDVLKDIVSTEDGWTGLWRGLKVNLILVANPMITYGLYQWLRGVLLRFRERLGFADAFLLGALSKVAATVATHPLIVAKTMLQSKPPDCRDGRRFRGFTEVLLFIIQHEGIRRLYKGLAPQIVKGFLVQGLMMMLKERACTWTMPSCILYEPIPANNMSSTASNTPFADPLWLNRTYSPYYTASHRRLQREVREYVDTYIAPFCEEWEQQGWVPIEVQTRHAELGYTAVAAFPLAKDYLRGQRLPGDIDPGEWDGFHDLIVIDELARCGYLGIVWALGCGNSIGGPPVINFGNEEQRRRFLPDMLTGKARFCLGVTEPDAGSDVAGITTTAERKGDVYIVNGAKKWITNGIFADYCTAGVRTGGEGIRGISALVIPLKAPGVTCRKIKNSGVEASGSTYIEFDQVQVPVANLLGQENNGFHIIMNNFNHERLWLACTSLRMARVCAEDAYKHAISRETFGKKLIENQVIRSKFSAMGRSLDSAYAWMEQLVYMSEMARKDGRDIAMGGLFANLKVLAGRTLEMVNREAQQVMGGLGYSKNGRGARIEQISRDVRVMVVGGGSEEILSDLAVREEIRAMARKAQSKL